MKWRTKEKVEWKRWFAWHPVCIDWKFEGGNEYIWLEWLERKTIHFRNSTRNQYRRIQEENERDRI